MRQPALNGIVRHLHRLAGRESSGELSDAALLRRYLDRRDQAAFEALVWRHAGLVLGTCRRLLGHDHDAEDAFQATFLAWARSAVAWLVAGAGWLGHHARADRTADEEAPAARAENEKDNPDAKDEPSLLGVVVTPDGKPAAEATVWLTGGT